MSNQKAKIRQYFLKEEMIRVTHYIIGEKIGKGGYATVHKALEIFTKMEVAVKIVDLEQLSSSQLYRLERQIEVHQSLDHPNIVKIYEYFYSDSKMYIAMELIQGKQLFYQLSKNGPVQEKMAVKIFHQICLTVKYLHDSGIVHRDLKTENVMIDSQLNVKIIDFGLARRVNNQERNQLLQTCCGSPSYIAPELLRFKKYDGKCVDIWCLGVTLFVMLEAHYPFDQSEEKLFRYKADTFKLRQCRLSSIEAMEVYKQIFQQSSKRPDIHQLLSLNFFNKYGLNAQKVENYEKVSSTSLNSSIIAEISRMLDIDSNKVQSTIKQKILSPSLCLYELLVRKQEKQLKMSQSSKIPHSERKTHTLSLISRSQKLRKQGATTPGDRRKFKTVQKIKDQTSSGKKIKQKIALNSKNKPISVKKKLDPSMEQSIFQNKCKNIFEQDIKMDHLRLKQRNLPYETSPKRITKYWKGQI